MLESYVIVECVRYFLIYQLSLRILSIKYNGLQRPPSIQGHRLFPQKYLRIIHEELPQVKMWITVHILMILHCLCGWNPMISWASFIEQCFLIMVSVSSISSRKGRGSGEGSGAWEAIPRFGASVRLYADFQRAYLRSNGNCPPDFPLLW